MLGCDLNQKLSSEKVKMLISHGYLFFIRYVGRYQMTSYDLSPEETDIIISSGGQLAVVQHCENENWIATKEKGFEYGQNAREFAKQCNYQKGCIVYLDLEGLHINHSIQDIIAFCIAWYDEVVQYYTPGVYIGFNVWLNNAQLYGALPFEHYWSAYNADRTPSPRGYEMIQKLEVAIGEITIDPDVVIGDKFGNTPIFMKGDNTMTNDQIRETLGMQDATWAKENGVMDEAKLIGLINEPHDPNEPATMGELIQIVTNLYNLLKPKSVVSNDDVLEGKQP